MSRVTGHLLSVTDERCSFVLAYSSWNVVLRCSRIVLRNKFHRPNFTCKTCDASNSSISHRFCALPASTRLRKISRTLHSFLSQFSSIAIMSTDSTLYEDHFEITTLTTGTYDRVTRVMGTSRSAGSSTSLTLDINSELYPLQSGDTVNLLIATTLNLDGTKDTGSAGWRDRSGEETLASAFDYVCYGKVYKHVDPGDGANM